MFKKPPPTRRSSSKPKGRVRPLIVPLLVIAAVSLLLLGGLRPERVLQSAQAAQDAQNSQKEGSPAQRELVAGDLSSRRLRVPSTPAELLEKARLGGPVRVIVGLRLDFEPEGRISNAAVTAQRSRIDQAQTTILNRLSTLRVSNIKRFESIPFIAFEVDATGLAELVNAPEVSTIEEDFVAHTSLAESTVVVGAPAAWASGSAGNGQAVAVLDTGVDKTHPFLTGKVVSEACYSTTGSDTTSVCPGGVAQSTAAGSGVNCTVGGCEHGTHVAGIAAGKSEAFSGVARDANIVAIQVFSRVNGCTGSDCITAFNSDIVLGLQRVAQLAGTVNIAAVNMSLGGGIFSSNCDASQAAFKAAIDNLRSLGIATIVASGNDGSNGAISSPACVSSAISVGSTGDGSGGSTLDAVSSFSNGASFLGLLAPGEYINSSVPGGGFSIFRGTSMATPHVAGAWAVLKSKLPTASVAQVLQALTNTGLAVTDTRNSIIKPRLRVDAALAALPAGACNFAIAPSLQAAVQNGGPGLINVTADNGCAWTAKSNVPWLVINNGSSGSGNGTVNYSVAINTGLERIGTMLIAGTAFTVTQAGAQVLSVDDGDYENSVGLTSGGTLCAVNRLTPSRYPSAIDGVAVQFPSSLGVAPGTPLTIVYGVNAGGGTDVNGINFRTVTSTVQTLDQMTLYPVPAIAAPSGDFVVGYCLSHPSGRLPVLIDQTSSKRRSYLSANGGAYLLVDDISSSIAGNIAIRAAIAPRHIYGNSLALTAESCAVVNQAIDPGEMVTVNVTLSNAGTEPVGNLVATLQPTGGVTAPNAPRTYGAMAPGATSSQSFSFTADPALACAGTITMTLQLQDGATNLGTVVFTQIVGPSSSASYSTQGSSVAIPDPGTIEIPITVPDAGVVRDVNVRVRINHAYDGDLDMYLIGPDGTRVELTTDNGGSADNYGTGSNNCSGAFTVFDDAAPSSITAGGAPFVGTFKPEGMLSDFNGRFMKGVWTLRITDDASLDSGTFGCWQLEIRSQPQPCCGSSCTFLSNASNSIGPIGTGVVLSGANLTGVTGVKFGNNTTAVFTVDSNTQITTSVPAGAASGPVIISKTGCPDFQFNYTVVTCPTVTAINPVREVAGASVTITGTNLTDVSAVRFSNGVNAQFTVSSATQITATVPAGAVTGPISLTRLGCGETQTPSFTVCPVITVNPSSLPAGTVGVQYSQALTASGSSGAYTFSLSSGTLPNGMTVSAAGVLSGVPTQSGTFSITIRASDTNGCPGTRSYTLTVNCPTLVIAPATLPSGTLNNPYSQNLTGSGGTAPYTFTVSSGSLPSGITLSSAGLLSGPPSRGGNFSFSIRASDANGCSIVQAYTLTITCADNIVVSPAVLPDSQGGVVYSQQMLSAAGGTGPYTFSVTSGALPSGLTLSTAGILTGTPNAAGVFNFTVTAAAANGCTGSRSYTMSVTVTLGPQSRPLYTLRNCASCANQIFGYAANEQTGSLTLLAGFPIATGGSGSSSFVSESLQVDRVNQRLYVLNGGCNAQTVPCAASVSAYRIDSTTGILIPLPFNPISLPLGGFWYSFALHPGGSPLVVGGLNAIQQPFVVSFNVGNNGEAAPGTPYFTGTAQPYTSAFSRNGNFYYAGGLSGTTFAGFAVNASTGAMTPLAGSPFSAVSSSPGAYATDEAGRLFISHLNLGSLRAFTTTDGIPGAVSGAPFTSGLSAGVVGLVHPAGFYMVADRSSNRIGVYRINGTGASTTLAAVTGSPFSSGGSFTDAITLNETGTLLFAANGDSRNLTVFSVNTSTGALTSLGTQPGNANGTTGRLTGIAYHSNLAPQTSPAPVLSSLDPSVMANGPAGFTVNLNGTGFVPTSKAKWNGADRPTTFVSSTRLIVTAAPGDATLVGNASISVFNPAPGGGTSNALNFTIASTAVTTSAATFLQGPVAPDSIVAAFGMGMAVGVQASATTPLPFLILGTSVQVRDSAGVSRQAPLFFVSPQQVNYLIPAGTAVGEATVTITSGDGKISVGSIQITTVSLGLFAANANGIGVAAANVVRVAASGTQTFEDVATFDLLQNRFVPRCLSLGSVSESVIPVMYGTGVRGLASLSGLSATVGGSVIPVAFSGAHSQFVGLDQINLGAIPRGLIGRGVVDIVIRVNGQAVNTVQMCIN